MARLRGNARAIVTLAVAASVLAPFHASRAGLRDAFTTQLGPLPDAFAVAVARSIPTLAASTGLSYEYNEESGTFVRVAPVLGQLFLERATPLGARRLNVNLSYQYVSFDSFDGEKIDKLHDTSPLIISTTATGKALLRVPRYAVQLNTDQVTLSVTYGATADLDVNLTVPFLHTQLERDVRLRSIDSDSGRGSLIPISPFAGSKAGIGDVLLRGKYRVLDSSSAAVALGLLLRLPTGNPDDFQGTGTPEVLPGLYVSPHEVALSKNVELRTYLNAGVNFDTEDVGQTEVRWGVGADAGWQERATIGLAVLGRHPFASLTAIDLPRCLDGRAECVADLPDLLTTRRGRAPLFGIGGKRPDYYDLSVGTRVALWSDRLIGFVNVLLPLNDEGPRADPIPLVGVEVTF